MSTAEREEFISRVDRALPGVVVESLTDAVAQRYGDRQPELLGWMSEAGPGSRLRAVAEALVENAAQHASASGMRYVPNEISRSAEVEFTSLEIARALQQAAELGPDGLTADGQYFADEALNAGGIAITAIQLHDIRGGLDSSSRLPGPQYPAPENPAPEWLQERMEGLATEYGKVLADHRDQHATMEAIRHSGIGMVDTPIAKGSSDGARSGPRVGETRHAGHQLGSQ